MLERHDINETAEPKQVKFKIYVAGEAANSIKALRNLRVLCEAHYGENYFIEVIDVLLSPELAWADGVIVTPTAIRIEPTPSPPIVGNLSNTSLVKYALGMNNA
jgi:circadian clock protein KaiB